MQRGSSKLSTEIDMPVKTTFGIAKMKNIDCQMVCSMLISGGNTSYLGKWCISLQTMMHGLPASATI
jgi:hypothetical protein